MHKNDSPLCAAKEGRLLSWGDNSHGQLGRSSKGSNATPNEVTVPSRPFRISCGWGHAILLCGAFVLFSEHGKESSVNTTSSEVERQREAVSRESGRLSGKGPQSPSIRREVSMLCY